MVMKSVLKDVAIDDPHNTGNEKIKASIIHYG